MDIKMVNIHKEYLDIKNEIDVAVSNVLLESNFINGRDVNDFENNLAKFLKIDNVIACANGTDALQIALMALNLKHEDEIIIPSFTYIATAEAAALLKLNIKLVDVNLNDFNLNLENIKNAVTSKTKVIVIVHLFGQCADIEPIIDFARSENIYVIEDTAQSIGSKYIFKNGETKYAGTIGDIGCLSFFPTKNLGCFGDGGAVVTSNNDLAYKIKMTANHGQVKKYIHKIIGINSRLDTIQASILNVKLNYLNKYIENRSNAALNYDKLLSNIKHIRIPIRSKNSTHVFNQYTLIVFNGKRNQLQEYLQSFGISTMIYYPIPIYNQEAYSYLNEFSNSHTNTELLCDSVLSLPMNPLITFNEQKFISEKIKSFFNK